MEEQLYVVLAIMLFALMILVGPMGVGELLVCELGGVEGLPVCS